MSFLYETLQTNIFVSTFIKHYQRLFPLVNAMHVSRTVSYFLYTQTNLSIFIPNRQAIQVQLTTFSTPRQTY